MTTPDLIKFKEPSMELMHELSDFMTENRIRPSKLFIVGKTHHLLVYQNIINEGYSREDFGVVIPSRLERGDILDSFSKIELIVNEILEAKVLKEGDSNRFSHLLEGITFAQKINLLNSWNLISEDTFQILHRLKSVRNVLAHSWHIENAIYGKNKTLKTNFSQFKEDIKKIWSRLINIYDFLKPQNKELKKILKQLKNIVNARSS